MGEQVEIRYIDDPKDMTRVWLIKVRLPQTVLLSGKWSVFWRIVLFLWKGVVRWNKKNG